MRRFYVLFLVFTFFLIQASTATGLPFTRFYSSKVYKGGIQNYAFTQDSYGSLFVANNFGLLHYDGTDWQRFGLPNSTKIRDLWVEQDEKVYVAAQGEIGYFHFQTGPEPVYHSLLQQLPEGYRDLEEVWKVFRLHEHLVFCTFQHLFVFDEHETLIRIIESESGFLSFHQHQQQLYVQDSEKGLLRLERDRLQGVPQGETLTEDLIRGMVKISPDALLLLQENGSILQLNDTERRLWPGEALPNLRSINVVSALKNGHMAIGTQFDGLYILDEKGSVTLHLDRNKGLENSTILSIFEDRAGNLWLGHSNGITLVELSLPFRLIDQRMGVLGTGYAARTHQNALYLATNIHLAILPPAAKDAFPIPNGEGQVYGLSQRGNDLLVARHAGGAVLGKNGLEALGGQMGVWGFLPLREQPELFIAGTYNGLALYQKEGDGPYRLLHEIEGFKESCRLIQWESDGSLWMSHSYKGVYKLTLSEDLKRVEARLYGTGEGLPTQLMNSVWKVGGRTIFTTEYGIYRYLPTEDRFEKDPTFSPYFDNDILITSLTEDPLGNIFYIGNKEVGVLEPQNDGSYKKNYQLFNKILPLLNDDLQNVSLIGPNEVLFAANEGFIRYTLRDAKAVPPQYPTLIRGIYRTGLSDSLLYRGGSKALFDRNFVQQAHTQAQFPYDMRDLRFEFTNTIPNQELSTQFRFYLEGLENNYGEWTEKRDKAYTNLREGKYTFYVQSRDLYGQISEVAAFSFSVLPPWYRNTWAYASYFLGALGILFIGFKRLDRAYEEKTAAITAKQDEVIAETSSQLERSQQELEQLRTEKLEAEIQSKNKKLASATMQLLNKNEFIDHAKNHLNQIIKKSRNQEVKQELQKVITSIDKNIAQDNDWEQFELYFDQVHGDFMQRFKGVYPTLSPQEIKLTAYLRMNLSSKEMAYLMNISTRGVEIARYRLRKKLNLERSDNLQEFILKF